LFVGKGTPFRTEMREVASGNGRWAGWMDEEGRREEYIMHDR
jgi:hypothetical protein